MVLKLLKTIWNWFREEEGMTWERYHRNMDKDRRENE